MDFNALTAVLMTRLNEKEKLTVAIDGRCASGKTSLAQKLSECFDCTVLHVDDFFLRPEQRTPERLGTPGGNFDIERFCDEVISGILSGKDFSYHKFDCASMSLGEEIHVTRKPLTVIEGSYSCHPDIRKYWDVKVFVTTDKDTQEERIRKRNPEKSDAFFAKWIPMEERYFEHFDIENCCDYIINT